MDLMGFLPTCKETHRLASEKLDRQLSGGERVRLQMHLFLCTACRNFDGQMRLIRSAMQGIANADEPARKRDPQ
jgi:predicted anti-sigma-YlaC factor YlaD